MKVEVGTPGVQVLGWPLRAQALGILFMTQGSPSLLWFQLWDSVPQQQQEQGAALSSPFLNQMAGNLFFSPHQCTHLCVKVLLRRVFRSKVDKCLRKANHFPQEEGSLLHSSCGGRAKRRRLTHPALEDTQGPRGEEQVSGAEMARSLPTSSRAGLLSPAPAPVSYAPSGVQNPPTPSKSLQCCS